MAVMRKLFGDMDLKEALKAHLIFEHVVDNQDKFDDLGNKLKNHLKSGIRDKCG